MPLKRDWGGMTWEDFADANPSWVAVLPIAAVEQHGPHLPLGTDAFIVEAYLARARKLLPDALNVTMPNRSSFNGMLAGISIRK